MKIQQKHKRKLALFSLVLFCFFAFSFFHSTFAIDTSSFSFITSVKAAPEESSGIGATVGGWFESGIKSMLLGIIHVIGKFIQAASILLTYVIDARNYTNLLNSPAIENSWKIIRDILNLAFILVLLFSAFATIFQVEKYHIKKIILTLIIMALLTNFSFPISRFIIDAANIPMYYIAQVVFGESSGSLGALIGEHSRVGELLKPAHSATQSSPFSAFFAAIIFGWIFFITVMALAILFLIRLVVLTILVIFSPLGFVAAILPSTKNYADDYWQTLFKNAFFGPIMLLVLALSIYILQAFQQDSLMKDAGNNVSDPESASQLALWAFYSIPIILLWGGMIWSQKLGAVGASIVINKANDIAKKSWGGMKPMLWVGDTATRATDATFNRVGLGRIAGFNSLYGQIRALPSAVKKAYWDDPGANSKQIREDRRDIVAGSLPFSEGTRRGARLQVQERNIAKQVKQMEDAHIDPSTAIAMLRSNNAVERNASARFLAKNDFLQTSDSLANAVRASQGDVSTLKLIGANLSDTAVGGLDPAQTQQIFTAINDVASKQNFSGIRDTTIINSQVTNTRRAFEKQFREKGRLDQLIEMDIANHIRTNPAANIDTVRAEAYDGSTANTHNTRIRSRSLAELAKQDISFFRDPNDPQNLRPGLEQYLNNLNTVRSRAYQNFYADLNTEKRQLLGLAPPQ
ncbi:MAG: hypothetical protein EOM19_01570 [Candidatus Moranbacteria bacterium]|nr:hypothetical protein [Candidatus Moranbacteria bacterium]